MTKSLQERVARKHFEDAMENGYVECTMTTCAVTGASGSGKSHTMSLVFNEDPPAVRESTGLCEPVRAISTVVGASESGSSEWTVVDEDEVLSRVAGATSVTNRKEQPTFLSKDASEHSGSSDAKVFQTVLRLLTQRGLRMLPILQTVLKHWSLPMPRVTLSLRNRLPT